MNKVKIPVERLKQIIQEEVTRFYSLEEDEDTELLDQPENDYDVGDDEDELLANPKEEGLDEQVSSTEMMNRQVGAEISSAISKLNALPADQARARLKQAGL